MAGSADDLDLEALKLAFLRHMLGRIAVADSVVQAPEQAVIDAVVPPAALRSAGLIDANGQPTDIADAASMRSLMVLPVQLSQADRLALVSQLVKLVTSDGGIDLREQSLVAMAGQLLGLSIPILAQHFSASGLNLRTVD